MARRRSCKTVNGEFIEDAETIVRLLNKHMTYLRVDSAHYEALRTLNSQVVATAGELHGGRVPWGERSSTGPVRFSDPGE